MASPLAPLFLALGIVLSAGGQLIAGLVAWGVGASLEVLARVTK